MAGILPRDIISPFRQNRMTHCATNAAAPVKMEPDHWKPSTIKNAVNAPTGIVIQIFRKLAEVGPPAANVPAQVMKIAQGGKFQGGIPMKTVVTARADATISAGGFFTDVLSFANPDGTVRQVELAHILC